MNSNASANAEQTASSEAKAAGAADNFDIEIEDNGHEYDPNQPLKDFNETYPNEDPIPALKKSTNGKEAVSSEDKEMKILALRKKLAQNGYAQRSVLMGERIQTHYVSPMSTENEMSVEDILSEIPEDDLQEVAIVQGRIFMPVNFVQRWILPTLRVRKALSVLKGESFPGGTETAMLYSIFDQSIIDFGR
jgi:hypothetical protein